MKVCSVDDCDKTAIARGWCHTHYKRWHIHGNPLITEKPRNRKCSIDDCGKKHSSLGFCAMHERRFRRHGDSKALLIKKGIYSSTVDAYEAQVVKSGGCWGWAGSVSSAGYALIFFEGKVLWGHRFSYENFIEPIMSGFQVCHICDNPICTKPTHLFQGSQKDNVRDCIKKGRFKRAPDESKRRGEGATFSKLTNVQVIEIKKMIKNGVGNTEISKLFDVTHGNISCIRLDRTWKHINIRAIENEQSEGD